MDSLAELIPNKHELNARLRPSLLLLLPAILVALAWVPQLLTMGGVILTFECNSGVTAPGITREFPECSGIAPDDNPL